MVKVLYEVISDMSSGLPPMYDSLGSTDPRRAVDRPGGEVADDQPVRNALRAQTGTEE